MKKVSSEKSKWKTWHKVFLGFVGIVVVLFVVLISSTKTAPANPAVKETSVKKPADNHLNIVYPIAKEFVKTKLRYPEEADFDWTPTLKKQISDSSFRVMGNVVTKNGFGVKEKFRFNCLLRYKGGDDADINNWEAMYVGLEK